MPDSRASGSLEPGKAGGDVMDGYQARELRAILAKRPGWEGLLPEGPGLREASDAQQADALIRRMDDDLRGAIEALRDIRSARRTLTPGDARRRADAALEAMGIDPNTNRGW